MQYLASTADKKLSRCWKIFSVETAFMKSFQNGKANGAHISGIFEQYVSIWTSRLAIRKIMIKKLNAHIFLSTNLKFHRSVLLIIIINNICPKAKCIIHPWLSPFTTVKHSKAIRTWFVLLCLVVTNHSMLSNCNLSSEEHRQIKRTDIFEAHSINTAKYSNKTVTMVYGVYCIEFAVRHVHWARSVYRLERKTLPVHE